MDTEDALLQAIHAAPTDDLARLALADWLEEQGQPERAELARHYLQLRRDQGRSSARREARVRALLLSGVRPCVPLRTNSVGMTFALVPPGTFKMGSPARERERYPDESPLHEVELTRAFYLGVVPVTQEQYEAFGNNPSCFAAGGEDRDAVAGLNTASFPVENVSWGAAVAFCEKLSALPAERDLGRTYRLPTEAEWEHACRGATSSRAPFLFGNALSSREANFDGEHPYGGAPVGEALGRPVPVYSGPPNVLGLYDMHGNVWEWCADWYDASYFEQSPRCDPTGPPGGSSRIVRGGSWNSWGKGCRAAHRGMDTPSEADNTVGFRVVLEVR